MVTQEEVDSLPDECGELMVSPDCPSLIADPNTAPEDLPAECQEDCQDLIDAAEADGEVTQAEVDAFPAACGEITVLAATGLATTGLGLGALLAAAFGLVLLRRSRATA